MYLFDAIANEHSLLLKIHQKRHGRCEQNYRFGETQISIRRIVESNAMNKELQRVDICGLAGLRL